MSLETKKIEAEAAAVYAARLAIEVEILKHQAEIERLTSHIQIQIKKESELKDKLDKLKGS